MRKKLFKKAVAAVLAMTMVFSLTGCSANEKNAAKIMEEAAKCMEDVSSLSYDMTMNMDISSDGQNMAIATTGKADCIVDPMLMKMDMTMDMGEAGSMASQMYMSEQDGKYVIYSGVDVDGKKTWQKQEMENANALKQYNAKASFELYLKSANSFKENGTETINDSEATRYDGIITGDTLNEVIESSGMLDQLSTLGVSSENMGDMLKDIGDLNISIWIDKESSMPVKYEMDMTSMMQSILNKAVADQDKAPEINISKSVMSMTISNINGVESFEIPQEVIDSAA